MPRPRKPEDQWMPPGVYRHARGFVYKPSRTETVKLCAIDATESQVWEAYRKLTDKQKVGGFRDLVEKFMESADFKDLAKTTQQDYHKYSIKVLGVFGAMEPSKILPQHVRKYMDLRGKKSRTQANREKAFMSRVFRWAYERGLVPSNPCRGVRQFKETPRDRYVTDTEYQVVYDNAPPAVRVAMEISYLCAARKGDILKLTFADVTDEGLFIRQGKTGVKQIKEWTPRLRRAINEARKLSNSGVRATYIIVQPNGFTYTDNGFNSAWQTTMKKAREVSGLKLDFTFHDIKAKAVSDFEGSSREKQLFTGHKTERQVATYDRKVRIVPSLGKE